MYRCYLLIILIYLFLYTPTFAQKQMQEVYGTVNLSKEKGMTEKLPYANIAVLLLPDSSFVTGATSDEKGIFKFKYHRNNSKKYLLKASYMGCQSAYVTLPSTSSSVDLGTFLLKEEAKNLKEVVVTALVQPTEQKGDTTIYHADAYKLPEGAYLEELIKRVPGLMYDSKQKSITYKGKPIQEITVNGKEFFKGNNKVALENLPAKFISQLKVYDKATEEEEITGVKEHEKNYVLDLQTKKAINQTLMAGLEGGYGNKNKMDLKGQMFRFKDNGENVSLVGNFGNRHLNTSFHKNHAGNIGGNISKNIGNQIQLMANINYAYSSTNNMSTSRNELYLAEKNQYGISAQQNKGVQQNASSYLNFKWNISKRTMLHVSGGGNFNHGEHSSNIHSAKFSQDPQLNLIRPFDRYEQSNDSIRMNENIQDNQQNSQSRGYYLSTSLIHQLRKKGHSIGFSMSSSANKQQGHQYKLSSATFFMLQDIYGKDSISAINQYQHTPTKLLNNEWNLNYTLQLNAKNHLQFSYGFRLQKEKQALYAYDLSDYDSLPPHQLPDDYAHHYIDSLSNQRESHIIQQPISVSYNFNGEKWSIQSKLTAIPQKRSLSQKEPHASINLFAHSAEWATSLSLLYQKDNYNLGISYEGNTRQPSLHELMAPTTYYSALYVSRSNPHLKASFQHHINLSFGNFNKGYSAYLMYNHEQNSVTQATIYHPKTGATETYPVNINGNWNLTGSSNFERKIGLFKLSTRAGGNYQHDPGLINESGSEEMKQSITKSAGIDTFLELSYLPSWGNIDLNGSWTFTQFKNTVSTTETNKSFTRYYTCGSTVNAQLPGHFHITSNCSYQIRNGSSIKSHAEDEVLWNLKLAWKFAKERRAEVSLTWADILNQQKAIKRTATSNGFYEYYTPQSGSYFMIALRYQFNRNN